MSRYVVEPLDRRLLFAAATLQTNWVTNGGNFQHTSYVPGTTAGLTASEIWSAAVTGGSVYHHQFVAGGGGQIYIADIRSNRNALTALDPATGAVTWSTPLPQNPPHQPTYANGRLYLQTMVANQTSTADLEAFDAVNGRLLWSANYPSQGVDYFPPSVDSSGIYINGGMYGGIYSYKADGTLRWWNSLQQVDRWSPSLQGGYVYTYTLGSFRKLNSAGNELWNVPVTTEAGMGGGQNLNSVLTADTAYLVDGQKLQAVSLSDGAVRWTRTAAGMYGNPAVANGIVYCPVATGINAYRASDGALVRSFTFSRKNSGLYLDPIVTDDTLVASADNKTYLYNLDGTLRQTLPVGGKLALDHGTLYIEDGTSVITDSAPVLHAYSFGTAVRGKIFQDDNGNGIQDGNERLSVDAGAGVYLDLDASGTYSAGDVLASNVDGGGRVSFNVSPGTYTARLILPAGATPTTATSATVAVVAGVAATLPSFGLTRTYVVGGHALQDFDENKISDGIAIAGRTIYADLNENAAYDAGEPAVVTDSSGLYSLNLPAGAYTLRQVLPDGYKETARTGGPDLTFANTGRVEVSATQSAASYDFLSRPPQTIAVHTFNDANNNGSLDAGEADSNGNTVYLDLNQNNSLDAGEPSALTNNGWAYFGVDAGSYLVRVLSGDPSRAAFPSSGVPVTANAGQANIVLSGMRYAQSITGTAFEDANGDGVQNNGETAYAKASVTAYLDLNNNGVYDFEPSAQVLTNGTFTFSYLAPGTYTVRLYIAAAAHAEQTNLPGGSAVSLAPGQTASTAAFGVRTYYAVYATAFNDKNADGTYTVGPDTILAGRTVYADLNNNGALDTGEPSSASSISNPIYLPPGTYTLRQVLTTGWRETGRYAFSPVAGGTFVADGRVRIPADVTNTNSGYLFYFGTRPIATLTVALFDDANANGTADAGEALSTAGGPVYADLNNNGVYDASTDIVAAGAGVVGKVSIRLVPGTYTIRQALVPGYVQTSPTDNAGQVLTILPTTDTSTLTFGRYAPPTAITAVKIDDGTAQNANRRSVTLTLNGTVAAGGILSGAFTLLNDNGTASGYGVTASAFTPMPGNQTLVTLTFSGSGLVHGSLADGRYKLVIDGSRILDSLGAAIDAAGTGQRMSVRTIALARLASDIDGSGAVDFNDFLVLQNAFGSRIGEITYFAAADGDLNGTVDFNDFLQLQNDFGHTMSPAALTVVRPGVPTAKDKRVRHAMPKTLPGAASRPAPLYKQLSR